MQQRCDSQIMKLSALHPECLAQQQTENHHIDGVQGPGFSYPLGKKTNGRVTIFQKVCNALGNQRLPFCLSQLGLLGHQLFHRHVLLGSLPKPPVTSEERRVLSCEQHSAAQRCRLAWRGVSGLFCRRAAGVRRAISCIAR